MRQLARREIGATALVLLLAMAVWAPTASAAPLAMDFSEARANVGKQLSDEALFAPPATAPLAAEIDPGSGAISGGELTVPEFTTFITDPLDAFVAVEFEIGVVSGSFTAGSGALVLEGTAGGTLTSEERECTVTTTPAVLSLSTAGSSGGTSPRAGTPFTQGLTGGGAIAGQWTDMQATPITPEDNAVCETVDERIGGPGGIWMKVDDTLPPAAPLLSATLPASPGRVGVPRILGSAEPGSTVHLFAGPSCAGAPLASSGAAELASPGIAVEVAEGVTAAFSATATDLAGNTSPCSAPIAYTRTSKPPPPPLPGCVVPNLIGKTLAKAKSALAAAGCRLGTVKHVPPKGKKRPPLVVKSSSPAAGAAPANGKVNVKLGPKPRKPRA